VGGGLALLGLLAACNHQPDGSVHQHATFAALNLMDAGSICPVSPVETTASNFFILLGAGLLTGLSHCVGMCGPLVGAFAMRRRAAHQDLSTSLVLFQVGRLTTYLMLGMLLGSVGYLLAQFIREWQGLLSLMLGLLLAFVGLSLLGILPLHHWLAATGLARWAGGWLKRLMSFNHPAASLGLGLVNGLLPCGPVYAMGLLAAASGDPLRGAMIMLIFGLGTLPTMLGLGFSTAILSLRLRSQLYRATAIVVTGVGLQLALRGLALGGQIAHTSLGSVMLW
jgi:sulfite exporter TauE/SafE